MGGREALRASIRSALSRASVRQLEVAGVSVYIRGLTGAERVLLQEWIKAAGEGGEPLTDYKVAALGLCDEDGTRLFADAAELSELDGAALGKIALAILEASGLGADAVEGARGN